MVFASYLKGLPAHPSYSLHIFGSLSIIYCAQSQKAQRHKGIKKISGRILVNKERSF